MEINTSYLQDFNDRQLSFSFTIINPFENAIGIVKMDAIKAERWLWSLEISLQNFVLEDIKDVVVVQTDMIKNRFVFF